MAPIRILIVDDHAIVRQGLRLLLENQASFEVVGEAASGLEAIRLTTELLPDIVLLDLIMPGMSGIEALRQIRQTQVSIKVLALTSSVEDQLVRDAIGAGADGYILKASRSADLLQAIEQVVQGKNVLTPEVAQVVMHQTRTSDPLDNFTRRERDVFDLLARGLSVTEVAQLLVISEATVRTHTASILDKLDLRDRTRVIIYALKRGLVRLDDLP